MYFIIYILYTFDIQYGKYTCIEKKSITFVETFDLCNILKTCFQCSQSYDK